MTCWFVASATAVAASGEVADVKNAPPMQAGEIPPEIRRRPTLAVPFDVYLAGVDGKVVLEFIVDTSGRVVNPVIVSSNNPAYNRPALESIVESRFAPATASGQPVARRWRYALNYDVVYGERELWRVEKPANHRQMPIELQWDEAPVVVSTSFPIYPFESLINKEEGRALVRFFVDPRGNAVDASVVQASSESYGGAAVAAVETWQFTPARREGKECYAVVQMEFLFAMDAYRAVPLMRDEVLMLRELARRPKGIATPDELDETPKPLSQRPPRYPGRLLASQISGDAVVEILVDREGFAQLPRIISASHPGFGFAAAHAVASWRFTPPKKDGKAIITRLQIPVAFNAKQSAPTAE